MDILSVASKVHDDLDPRWGRVKAALPDTLAMLTEVYSDSEIYFLARDGEILYDYARSVLGPNSPEGRRIHLINISRLNMNDPHLKDYLAQEGIVEEGLEKGKKIVMVDTGFSGTIPKKIDSIFSQKAGKQIKTQLMLSETSKYPSSRVFLSHMNSIAPYLTPEEVHGSIIAYEHLPKATDRSNRFEQVDNKWTAASDIESRSTGPKNKEMALRYQEDLRNFAGKTESTARLSEQRNIWRKIMELHNGNKREELITYLKELTQKWQEEPQFEAIVRDYIEISKTNLERHFEPIELSEFSLPESTTSQAKQLKHLQERFPKRKELLENPEKIIGQLFREAKYKEVEDTLDFLSFATVRNAFLNELKSASLNHDVMSIVAKSIEQSQREVLENLPKLYFSRSGVEKIKDVDKILAYFINIAEEDALDNLIEYFFEKPHSAKLKETPNLIKQLIEVGDDQITSALAEVLKKKHFAQDEKYKTLREALAMRDKNKRAKFLEEHFPSLMATTEEAPIQPGKYLESVYDNILIAQDNGGYSNILNKIQQDSKIDQKIEHEIIFHLEEIKKLPPKQRADEINEIFRYYSVSNEGFKDTPIGLINRVGGNLEEISTGNYESDKLGKAMIQGIKDYDKEITVPILQQVQKELVTDFPRQQVLFLGRDFAVGEVWMKGAEATQKDRFHMINASRMIRDQALNGKMTELVQLIKQSGVDKAEMIKNGIVIVDSSSGGKIPAAILEALCDDMIDEERFRFLTNSHIRYLKSSVQEGVPLDKRALAHANDGKISKQMAKDIVWDRQGIDIFKVPRPAGISIEFGMPNLAEHRPKVLTTAQDIVPADGGRVSLKMPYPTTNGKKINSLLGLASDLQLSKLSKTPRFTILPEAIQKEINVVAKQGRSAMQLWQNSMGPSVANKFKQMKVVSIENEDFPLELQINGKSIVRLKKKLGEGNNIVAYESERGTVIKVTKEAENAKKNLLLAWADNEISNEGIKTAKVLAVESDGLYLEQEFYPGDSLEGKFGLKEVPVEIKEQIFKDWERAKSLAKRKDIWLDLKSANYQLGADGKIVMVDYVPRLNSSYYRYFQNDNGTSHSKETFQDLFFNYDLKKTQAKIATAGIATTEVEAKKQAVKAQAEITINVGNVTTETSIIEIDKAAGIKLKTGDKFRLSSENDGKGKVYEVVSEATDAGEDRRVYKIN